MRIQTNGGIHGERQIQGGRSKDDSKAGMLRVRRGDGRRETDLFAFCSMCCCYSAGKQGDVKTRKENEINKRKGNESTDAEKKD